MVYGMLWDMLAVRYQVLTLMLRISWTLACAKRAPNPQPPCTNTQGIVDIDVEQDDRVPCHKGSTGSKQNQTLASSLSASCAGISCKCLGGARGSEAIRHSSTTAHTMLRLHHHHIASSAASSHNAS